MSKLLPFFLLLSLLPGVLRTQDAPLCSGSTLQLQSLELDFTQARASFLLSGEAEVLTYELLHEYVRDGEEVREVVRSEAPLISITFSPQGVHRFTAVNQCTDGTIHTGSSLILDFGQDGVDAACPTPTNLFIETFTPGFVAFGWDAADTVDFWQIRYQPEGLPAQDFMVTDPFVEQDLLPTVRHTFSLFAVCDEDGLTSPITQTVSPTVTFSLIIVEDVKLFPITCDSLTELVWDAFLMECTRHGAFEADKEAFVFIHGCEACVTATALDDPAAEFFRTWTLAPNPVREEAQLQYVLPEATRLEASLFDAVGRPVKQYVTPLLAAGEGVIELPLGELPPGVYWVQLHTGNRSGVKKMVKAGR
ncbi:T9SS type A sorting domain-containing protein [Lewinella sp. W8]|uniref:T9SS type A sorting domain-containing protein n=1 Tax=Lewinella sp. W8 TaxID=2528208 RepID=UPI001067EF5B|nr:T9SS type A sorting domain-containing protein [Lewinella sp. W8]MTB51665.1 T9SS type A sorting domain-containing protein [Lewinella sp. W8]